MTKLEALSGVTKLERGRLTKLVTLPRQKVTKVVKLTKVVGWVVTKMVSCDKSSHCDKTGCYTPLRVSPDLR